MGIFDNFASFSLSMCCFCIILGAAKLVIPQNFKSSINPALELMLFIIMISQIKNNAVSLPFEEYAEASYNFSLPYKDLQEQYMEAELTKTVEDNLKNRGIIPSDIRIDISIENDEVTINGCHLSIRKEQTEDFLKKKETLEKELGFSFYLTGEENE